MRPSKARSLEILKCLAKGTSINMITRYDSFTEKEVRTVLRKNYYETNEEYTKKWKKMKIVRDELSFPKTENRKITNKELEIMLKRRLQGETYAQIEKDYPIEKGFLGNICAPQNQRILPKKLLVLWEEIQKRRIELDNRYIS
jgi:hypothetical protein